MPPVLLERDAMEPSLRVAWRFGMFRDLPEHPLFHLIHARLVAGYSPWKIATWVQESVPDEDPFAIGRMDRRVLYRKLKRYRNMLPPAVMLPESYLDQLTKKIDVCIDVVPRLAALILYQEQRISQFAKNEKNFPLGITSEQQRKEVVTLADLLTKMRDTQIALGLVPGTLMPNVSIRHSTLAITASEFDLPASDPFTRFLEENPSAISMVMAALDSALNQDSNSTVASVAPGGPEVSWRRIGTPLSRSNP